MPGNKLIIADNLSQVLYKLDNNKCEFLDLDLIISMEKDYYESDNFALLCKALKNDLLNNGNYINFNNKKYRIQSFVINVGDILNRHNWYYRHISQYLQNNNLKDDFSISESIKKELCDESYRKSEKQGLEWFYNNINGINELIPEDYRISKDIKLNDEITVLYEGDKDHPKIEYICYKYWLNHPCYNSVHLSLSELSNNENSVIYRGFEYELDFFHKIFSKQKRIMHESLFRQQSKNYLLDETTQYIIKHREKNNVIELYVAGDEPKTTMTFRGKKAQKDPIIQQYLQGPLKGADQRKFVSIKMTEEK